MKETVECSLQARRLRDAPKTFSDLPIIDLDDMSAETQRDMKLHVEKEVAKHEKLAHLHDVIAPSLLENADGMFRWVQCQLDRLRNCRTINDVHKVLATFPSRLRQTYDRILSDINENEFDGKIVKSALLWLVGARKPLSQRALVEAVTFDMQDELLPGEEILDICRGLVSYDKTDGGVSLLHFSVKEYLFDEHLRTGAHSSQYHFSSTIAHKHLAKLYNDYSRTFQTTSPQHEMGGVFKSLQVGTLQDYMENFGKDHLSLLQKPRNFRTNQCNPCQHSRRLNLNSIH
ncbi:hypothetical protein BU15DRAFT_78782 [Melanogaster broomeanus]|nr:hypothetical protein BU15DRAFT_78782 [Melanogaster broomeanus]